MLYGDNSGSPYGLLPFANWANKSITGKIVQAKTQNANALLSKCLPQQRRIKVSNLSEGKSWKWLFLQINDFRIWTPHGCSMQKRPISTFLTLARKCIAKSVVYIALISTYNTSCPCAKARNKWANHRLAQGPKSYWDMGGFLFATLATLVTNVSSRHLMGTLKGITTSFVSGFQRLVLINAKMHPSFHWVDIPRAFVHNSI